MRVPTIALSSLLGLLGMSFLVGRASAACLNSITDFVMDEVDRNNVTEIAEYVFCSNTTVTIAPPAELPFQVFNPNIRIKCGDSGERSNECIIKNSADMDARPSVVVAHYSALPAPQILPPPRRKDLDPVNVEFHGFTFDGGSSFVTSDVPASVTFKDCAFTNGKGEPKGLFSLSIGPDTAQPTAMPITAQPTAMPITVKPTGTPSMEPNTTMPTYSPSLSPTVSPTEICDANRTCPNDLCCSTSKFCGTGTAYCAPGNCLSGCKNVTDVPTLAPTMSPTAAPNNDTQTPTVSPTAAPVPSTNDTTAEPTMSPTLAPVPTSNVTTSEPTMSPTLAPVPTSNVSTSTPTVSPTAAPVPATNDTTSEPTMSPASAPTNATDSTTRRELLGHADLSHSVPHASTHTGGDRRRLNSVDGDGKMTSFMFEMCQFEDNDITTRLGAGSLMSATDAHIVLNECRFDKNSFALSSTETAKTALFYGLNTKLDITKSCVTNTDKVLFLFGLFAMGPDATFNYSSAMNYGADNNFPENVTECTGITTVEGTTNMSELVLDEAMVNITCAEKFTEPTCPLDDGSTSTPTAMPSGEPTKSPSAADGNATNAPTKAPSAAVDAFVSSAVVAAVSLLFVALV